MKFHLTLEFRTGLHHGSGFGLAGLVDRPFLRDSGGMPYLSGAALKGKFRHAALRLQNSLEEKDGLERMVCKQYCRGPEPCLVCVLFGSPRRPGVLMFRDARAVAEEAAILAIALSGPLTKGTSVRATTAIDRVRRVTKENHLFTSEVAPPLTFESVIDGVPAEQAEFLKQCALVLTHFGGDSSRGLGECEYRLRQEGQEA